MRNFLIFLLVICLIVGITVRVRYGGGDTYTDLTTAPLLSNDQLELSLDYPEPIGSVAVSDNGRVFFHCSPGVAARGQQASGMGF